MYIKRLGYTHDASYIGFLISSSFLNYEKYIVIFLIIIKNKKDVDQIIT